MSVWLLLQTGFQTLGAPGQLNCVFQLVVCQQNVLYVIFRLYDIIRGGYQVTLCRL